MISQRPPWWYFHRFLQNVRVTQPMPDIADRISKEIAQAEAALGEQGRVLVRASGTEPVIRVMVEAAEQATAQQTCDGLCAAVEASSSDHVTGGWPDLRAAAS